MVNMLKAGYPLTVRGNSVQRFKCSHNNNSGKGPQLHSQTLVKFPRQKSLYRISQLRILPRERVVRLLRMVEAPGIEPGSGKSFTRLLHAYPVF